MKGILQEQNPFLIDCCYKEMNAMTYLDHLQPQTYSVASAASCREALFMDPISVEAVTLLLICLQLMDSSLGKMWCSKEKASNNEGF